MYKYIFIYGVGEFVDMEKEFTIWVPYIYIYIYDEEFHYFQHPRFEYIIMCI